MTSITYQPRQGVIIDDDWTLGLALEGVARPLNITDDKN